MQLRYAIESPLPDKQNPLLVGTGNALVIEGWAFCREADLESLTLLVLSAESPLQKIPIREFKIARRDIMAQFAADEWSPDERLRALRSGFWTVLPIHPSPAPQELRLLATFTSGNSLVSAHHTLSVAAAPPLPTPSPLDAPLPTQPKICICMATFNPDPSAFRRQIASIRAQTHSHWSCLLQDDGSSPQNLEHIRAALANDPRFTLFTSSQNRGFYQNFEQALTRVPPDADLVALADQDDHWYPEKLATLRAAFTTPDTTLAYSDMRIVDEDGNLLSNTYWTTRKNNFTDIESLFFANTITGAASLFKAALLPHILPFPPKIGTAYHDWWIALCALSAGRIQYIPRPLHDYYQHPSNAAGWATRTARPVHLTKIRSRTYRHELVLAARSNYSYRCKFLAQCALILRDRFPHSEKLPALHRLARIAENPIPALASQSLRAFLGRRASAPQERNTLLAYLMMRTLNLWFKKKYRHAHPAELAPLRRDAMDIAVENRAIPANFIQSKIAPLPLAISPAEPPRLNILQEMIDFRYFFGGYIGMFQFARHLAQLGQKIRLVVLESQGFDPAFWRSEIKKYRGLEDTFDLIEIASAADRSIPLAVSPADRFLATSCWTAHVAHDAAQRTNGKPFLFLIQEYEPCFVPHGSLHAISSAAYDLPHLGIFSTELLRDYFRQNRIGLYANGAAAGDARSLSFQNAILPFDITPERLARTGKNKFLFYARPEDHAQRNMFELGILALRHAMNAGALNPKQWDFLGIGTVGTSFTVPLPGTTLRTLPRTNLKIYADLLPTCDLGLSLMYTPHPSLVPLEMAAAGMIAVTNTFANKSAEALRAISSNIEPAAPTIPAIAEALARAEARIPNLGARAAAAKIHWPTDWNDALSPQRLAPLLNELGAAS